MHLWRSPLAGHIPRTYLGADRTYLTWLQHAGVDGDPLHDAAAKDWAAQDYRSYLVTVGREARPKAAAGSPPASQKID